MGWLSGGDESKSNNSLYRLFGGSTPDPDWPASTFLNHVNQGWAKNELVFSCIQEKATSFPEGTLRVYDALGRTGEPVQGHPLRRLLANPNPLISEFDLFELLLTHLDLAGNAFWEIVRDRSGKVVELWPLRPDRVRMKRSGRTVSYGYAVADNMYGRNDGAKTIPVELVHFKLPNPVDPLVGSPPMRAALRATALDNEATDFVKALLQNHAIPGVVVKMAQLDAVLDDATTTRLKEKWKQSYSGKRRGEPAFLQAGMDVQELGLNLKDLEFPDLRTISESRICMSFGVPPIILGAKVGLDRSTFSNYQEARKSFWEQTLMPLQRRVRDTVAAQLLPKVNGTGGPGSRGMTNVSLRWDNSEVVALRESETDRWNRATEAFRAGGLTVNDYRRVLGEPEVDGGDVFLMPSGVIATRDMAGAVENLDGQQRDQDPAPPKGDPVHLETKASSIRDAQDAAHEKILLDYFEERRSDVLATIGGKAALVNRANWNEDLTGRLYRVGLAAATVAGVNAWDGYDKSRTENYQHARAQGIAEEVNASLDEDSQDAITSDDPRQSVNNLFDDRISRTPGMATTLTTAAMGWGATEAGRQASYDGRTATKTWMTGGNPRSSHAALDGVTVGLDETFPNGCAWPGDISGGADEVAGCNCTIVVNIE